jgi:hypothetical protein
VEGPDREWYTEGIPLGKGREVFDTELYGVLWSFGNRRRKARRVRVLTAIGLSVSDQETVTRRSIRGQDKL